MKDSPHRRKHVKAKAVRKAQSEAKVDRDVKAPKKAQVKRASTSKKTVARNRGRAPTSHRSKRTSTKEVTFETEPEHIHFEGLKWIQSTQKQILDHTIRFSKKLVQYGNRARRKWR
ncbi:MAG: hypothetical protein SP1CHLAM54_11900 [Chlamydiia bacterium]|nr:hypothetical protein [Chlamydiia bacterium]MCH9616089.1 hypothetical protein [Chlamydiia bacterium]MCH9629488.1 hypothetical protein [Chlamydiia bacterium]